MFLLDSRNNIIVRRRTYVIVLCLFSLIINLMVSVGRYRLQYYVKWIIFEKSRTAHAPMQPYVFTRHVL